MLKDGESWLILVGGTQVGTRCIFKYELLRTTGTPHVARHFLAQFVERYHICSSSSTACPMVRGNVFGASGRLAANMNL
jgi:hypothetical protein